MTPAERDRSNLELLLRLVADLRRRSLPHTRDRIVSDRDERDLAAYRLAIIGESCNQLSPEPKARHSGLPWPQIRRMRNILVHAYDDVDPEVVFEALQNDLNPIEAMCRAELAAHP